MDECWYEPRWRCGGNYCCYWCKEPILYDVSVVVAVAGAMNRYDACWVKETCDVGTTLRCGNNPLMIECTSRTTECVLGSRMIRIAIDDERTYSTTCAMACVLNAERRSLVQGGCEVCGRRSDEPRRVMRASIQLG